MPFAYCENKGANQLISAFCFAIYVDSTIPFNPKFEISSLYPSSVAVQRGLCRTWSETHKTGSLMTQLIL